jgi:hypothetical protein
VTEPDLSDISFEALVDQIMVFVVVGGGGGLDATTTQVLTSKGLGEGLRKIQISFL